MRWSLVLSVFFCVLSLAPFGTAFSQTCVDPPSGLVSWWPGDGNADDIVGANPGTLQNGATFGAGLVGQAFSFDGVDDSITIAHNPNLDFSSFSIDALVKVPSVKSGFGGWQTIFSDWHSFLPTPTFQLSNYEITIAPSGVSGQNPGAVQLWFTINGGSLIRAGQGTTNVADGDWHHVTTTYDSVAGEIKIYVDGVLEPLSTPGLASAPLPGDIPDTTTLTRFIGRDGIGLFLEGFVDEVEIFDRVLSASEIQAIFNAGGAGKCKIDRIVEIIIGMIASIESLNLEQGIENSLLAKFTGFATEIVALPLDRLMEQEGIFYFFRMLDASIIQVEALRGAELLTDEQAVFLVLVYNSARSNVSN